MLVLKVNGVLIAVKKCRTSVGACSWLRCDWSIYILGSGLAKGELNQV